MTSFFSSLYFDIYGPRYIAAFLIGLNLALSGFLMQILTKNNLADTKIMGVSSGGLVAVAILTVLNIPFENYIYIPVIFLGCVFSTFAIYLIGSRAKHNSVYILLSGIGISGLLYSIAISIFILNNEDLLAVYAWTMGSLTNTTWEQVYFLLPISILGLVFTYLLSTTLKIYELGYESALSLGLNYKLYSFMLVMIITILASSTVSVAGSIGFIGILVPNLMRTFLKSDYKKIILYCSVFGGLTLVVSQLISQSISINQDIPVGTMTAIIGAVFLILRNMQWKQQA